jgi:hypothetical protein
MARTRRAVDQARGRGPNRAWHLGYDGLRRILHVYSMRVYGQVFWGICFLFLGLTVLVLALIFWHFVSSEGWTGKRDLIPRTSKDALWIERAASPRHRNTEGPGF